LAWDNDQIGTANGIGNRHRCGAFEVDQDERGTGGGSFDFVNDRLFGHIGQNLKALRLPCPLRQCGDGAVRVGVDDDDSSALLCQLRSEYDCGGRFSRAALRAGKNDDRHQRILSAIRKLMVSQ
jgi:hypothetical protein